MPVPSKKLDLILSTATRCAAPVLLILARLNLNPFRRLALILSPSDEDRSRMCHALGASYLPRGCFKRRRTEVKCRFTFDMYLNRQKSKNPFPGWVGATSVNGHEIFPWTVLNIS